jgi:hypothetical protein
MSTGPTQSRLVTTLWFVAAGLAFLALGIRLTSGRRSGIGLMVGATFCLVMGIISLAKSRRPPQA